MVMKPIDGPDQPSCLFFSPILADAIEALFDERAPSVKRVEFARGTSQDALLSHENSDLDKSHPQVIVGDDAKTVQDRSDRSARPRRAGAKRPATRPVCAGLGHVGPGRAQDARDQKGKSQ